MYFFTYKVQMEIENYKNWLGRQDLHR